MWMECDTLYFQRRARQERAAATKAPHPNARKAHLTMAVRFEELSGALDEDEEQWTPHSSRMHARSGVH